jgi:SAM-dependent methyltransferase
MQETVAIRETFAHSEPKNLDHIKNLNLGCGTAIDPNCINLDRADLPGVNVVHDITKLPLPFPAERFERIICHDVLEHLDIVPIMHELHRILAAGGILEIRVPHFTSANTYIDPTHIKGYSIETFDFFTVNGPRSYYFKFAFSEITHRFLSFKKGGKSFFLNSIIEPLVNSSLKWQIYFEHSLLRTFPAENVHITLKK